jgi:hypothetical protein
MLPVLLGYFAPVFGDILHRFVGTFCTNKRQKKLVYFVQGEREVRVEPTGGDL